MLDVQTYNRQDTLNGVTLDVGHVLTTDLKIAEGDARKGDVAVLGPVVVRRQVADHVHSKGAVPRRQDVVEYEELNDHVGDVTDLREEEEDDEVAAESVYVGGKR